MSRLPANVRRRSGPSKPSGETVQIPTTEGPLSESLGPFIVLPTSVNGLSAILTGVGDDVTEAEGEHDDGDNPNMTCAIVFEMDAADRTALPGGSWWPRLLPGSSLAAPAER